MEERKDIARPYLERSSRRKNGSEDADWNRLLGIGDVHVGADNMVSALEYYERALAQVRHANAPESVAIAIEIKMADCLSRRGLHPEAKTRLQSMYERALATGDTVLAARVRGRIGQVHNTLCDYETARVDCLEAYRVLRSTDAHEEIGNLELTLGAIFHRTGDGARAREYYENALATFRRIDDSEGIARTLNNLGVLLIKGSRWAEAREYFTRAIAVAEEAGNYARMATTCLNLGILCYTAGEWDVSARHLTRALAISKETQPTLRVVRANIALGILKLRRREFAAAGTHFHQILEIARNNGYRREEALALEFLGERALRLGDLDTAENYLQEATRICVEALAEGDVLAEVDTRLAEIALLRGDADRAEQLGRTALEIAERFEDGVEIGRALQVLAQVAAARDRFDEAEALFDRATRALAATPDIVALCQARFAQAKFWVLRGTRREAPGAARDDERESVATFEDLATRFLELELPDLAVESIIELARARSAFGALDDALAAIGRGLALAESHSVPHVVHKLESLRAEVEERCADESLTQWEEFRLLQEVAGFGPSDPAEMVEAYLRLACERSRSDRAVLAIRRGGREIEIESALGFDDGSPRRSVLAMLFDEFASGRKIHVVNQPRHDSRWGQFQPLVTEVGAAVAIPIVLSGDQRALLYVDRLEGNSNGAYRNSDLRLLSFFAGVMGVFLSVREGERRSRRRREHERDVEDAFSKFVTCNDELRRSIGLLRKLGRSDAGVLITGETGTGKGLLARLVHDASNRASGAFVPINCAALPESLLESELFGHVQGAFTGAVREKLGLFEEAEGGTLFLDEVDKAPLGVQAKLLHVLDKHEIRPVGSTRWKTVDVRVICATNADLREAIESGAFLEDLYYRLNDFQVNIPPLRQRREDIPLLVRHFYQRFLVELGRRNVTLKREVLQTLSDHDWRGNVRELEKVVKRMLVLAEDGDTLGLDALPHEVLSPSVATSRPRGTLRHEVQRLEGQLIAEALRACNGDKSEVARQLHVSYPCLLAKIKQYNLEPKRRGRRVSSARRAAAGS